MGGTVLGLAGSGEVPEGHHPCRVLAEVDIDVDAEAVGAAAAAAVMRGGTSHSARTGDTSPVTGKVGAPISEVSVLAGAAA